MVSSYITSGITPTAYSAITSRCVLDSRIFGFHLVCVTLLYDYPVQFTEASCGMLQNTIPFIIGSINYVVAPLCRVFGF